ncbi:MAG TPA: hypothetical protein VIV12_29730 [Streptosporangiaceae bacterium]
MARAVRYDLIINDAKWTRGLRSAERSSERFTQHTNRAGQALKAATAAFSVGVVVNQMKNWVAAARDSNRVAAQTNAVIKSTHGAAGLSAQGFADLAKSIEKTTAVDDDLIQGGEDIIATFTAIHGDVFKKTTKAAVDLAAGMNHGEVTAEGLQTASIQLGKALQDPISGLTSLQRIGIKFTDQQKQQIATMMKAGNVAGAQGVILAEVNRQFAGSAAAAVTPAKRLAQQWGDMQEVLGNLLIPAIDRGAQILSSILGVVDRNRTAFGVLFGVLGTGAAIIGTLVVAEKIHKATTEGVAAVTKAWEGAQKGLNLVLGLTRAQALTTAAAEDALAASTTAAGTAAAGASASVGAGGLAGSLRTVGSAAIGPIAAIGALIPLFNLSKQAVKDNVSTWDEFRFQVLHQSVPAIDKAREAANKHAGATKGDALQTAYAAQQTEAQRRAMVASLPAYQTAADKARLNAEAIKGLSGRTKELRDQLGGARDSLASVIPAFEGYKRESGITASTILRNLRQEVAAYGSWAKDARNLLKRGASQEFVQALSAKGPQYVHAFAVGSNTQLGLAQKYFGLRMGNIKSLMDLDPTVQAMKRKLRDLQAQINKLKGKTITITARTDVQISKSVRQYLAASNVPGFHQKGAKIPGYGGGDVYPAMLEPGEAVVPKEKARRPDFKAWAKSMGIPGFQFGGLVGRYYNPTVSETRRIGISEGKVAAAAMKQLVASFGGFTGGAASGNVIRLALAQAKRMAASFKVALALIEAGIVESGLRNLPYGDRDSLGFLQQRPSQGWAHPMNISYASWDFLRRAIPIQGRYSTAGRLAQAVQRSAFPARYDMQQARALGILHAYNYDQGGVLPPGRVAINTTGRPEALGFDYDQLYVVFLRALKDAGAGQVVLNGRRMDQQLSGAHVLNAGRR